MRLASQAPSPASSLCRLPAVILARLGRIRGPSAGTSVWSTPLAHDRAVRHLGGLSERERRRLKTRDHVRPRRFAWAARCGTSVWSTPLAHDRAVRHLGGLSERERRRLKTRDHCPSGSPPSMCPGAVWAALVRLVSGSARAAGVTAWLAAAHAGGTDNEPTEAARPKLAATPAPRPEEPSDEPSWLPSELIARPRMSRPEATAVTPHVNRPPAWRREEKPWPDLTTQRPAGHQPTNTETADVTARGHRGDAACESASRVAA